MITFCNDAFIDFFFFCGLIITALTQNLFSDSDTESPNKTILTDIIPEVAARPLASNPALNNETVINLQRKLIRWFVCRGSSGFRDRKNFTNEKSNYYTLFGESNPNCAFRKQRVSAAIHRNGRKPAYCW